ncbi:hypothetical protein QMZ92_16465 [Streptomyces sp. HNM0645]|uniref:hypothetical protein n=1 Tax=Streptomyces sp. HNM0645 TaxID=2782343 RepID=UPI0024B833CF|nr:hypothetical protein [Streptomyces sp. HNM0645]MDI9885929.1 hypothetical protein [Streptomyces sp. HNM0645]
MLPRPVADLLALWRGLVHHPREVVLVRCHHQWRGAGFIALIAVLVAAGVPGFPPQSLGLAIALGGPGWALDLAGTLAHGLWSSGRIWRGIECDCCGGDPGDGDDEPDPELPDDPHGIARDFETYLRNQTPAR